MIAVNRLEKIGIFKVMFLLWVMFGIQCWNPFDPKMEKSEETYGQFETKDAVLETYETAYITRDITLYEQCLANDFVFVFNPLDRAALDSLGLLDESWGKTKEIENTRKIFLNVEALNYKMTPFSQTDLSGDQTEYLYREKLDLTVSFSGQIFYIYGDALFIVKKLSEKNWKIVRIEDLTRS